MKYCKFTENQTYINLETIGVRFDYMYNGDKIPLLILKKNGETERIDRLIQIDKSDPNYASNQTTTYSCIVNGKAVDLLYDNDTWYIKR